MAFEKADMFPSAAQDDLVDPDIDGGSSPFDAHYPLNWSAARKLSVLIVAAIWTFLGTTNMIIVGPTLPAIAADLQAPMALTSYTIGGPLLAYGVASLIWVAFGNRYGVRLSFVSSSFV